MASVPQTKFNTVLPTQDQASPPNQLTVGELTQVDFEVTVDGVKTTYSAPLAADNVPGSTVVTLFKDTTPAFAPIPGKTYTADAFVVDAAGNGLPSTSVTWQQIAAAAAPGSPTGFSVE